MVKRIALLSHLLAIIFGVVQTCDLIKSSIDFEIIGEGFHRTLRIATNLTGIARFINCRISYQLQIPDGAYIDVDELHQLTSLSGAAPAHAGHCFLAGRFDTERPAGSPQIPPLQPILFHSRRLMRKVFFFEDVLTFPIHIRYHSAIGQRYDENEHATKKDATNTVKFNPPRVFLRCEENSTLLADPSCRRHVEKVPCECSSENSSKCAAIRLEPSVTNAVYSVVVIVPVGIRAHLPVVYVVTLLSVVLSVLYLVFNLCNDRKSDCKEKHK